MSEEIKEVKLNIGLDEKDTYINLFQKGYGLSVHEDFIQKFEDKKHNINSHAKWFRDKVKLNHSKDDEYIINKRKICLVDYGMNVGTEINGIRPSVIYKGSSFKYGEDIIVIPLTSFDSDKSIGRFSVEIENNDKNGLKNKSLIKIRQLRCVSTKRIRKVKRSNKIKILGNIVGDSIRLKIDDKVKIMLGL